nr:collagen type IV alpha-3-binding protein isoform X2 [Halyomorpha halys]
MADDHEAITDEDDDSDNGFQPELQGVLFKWTNYIHGWQKRFIVLKDGTLSYYKSREEQGFGCRGALSLFKATIKPHEFDECRFDVSVNDCVWYLRAETPEDKQHWVDILEAFKAESGYNSECSLRRHGSAVSLTSVTLSSASASSFKKCRDLKLKLAEMETYRDILCSQMDTLQRYFDSCADYDLKKQNLDDEVENINGKVAAVDFKGEAMTFKATSGAVLTGLAQCIEAITKREEMWKRKLEKEHQRLLRLEETCLLLRDRKSTKVGPDQEEGPHSTLGDEEFYDAVETGLERIEEEVALRELLRQSSITEPPPSLDNATTHPLWTEIERVTKEQVHYASLGVGEGGWQLFAEEGDMKMYRREEELNGLVIDPLKACHIVKGVTGREMCHYFFSPQYRKDWETTLEQMTVVEKISDNVLVFLQVHKRVWPTAQRDALFWSHTTHMTDPKDHDGHDIWAVVNHSTQLPQYPQKSNKCVRVALTVCLYCQTLITPPKDGTKVSRDDITCKITYCAVVNPGGWVPASALRALYKREYPKFLKRFTAYVITQTKDKPIMF